MPTRAELEAQLRELEAKRDRLEEHIARERLAPHPLPEGRTPATPAAVLEILDKVMIAIQPQHGMLVNAREHLIAECEAARHRNDTAAVSEASRMLDHLNTLFVEFSENASKLNALAEALRAAIASEVPNAGNEDNAG